MDSWPGMPKHMIEPITFFAPGTPKGQPRPRAFARQINGNWAARVYDAGTAEGWKSQVAMAAQGHLPKEPLLGPLKLVLMFTLKRPGKHFRSNGQLKNDSPLWVETKPDAENLAKAVMDCMTVLGFWRDDAQIAKLEIEKTYGDQTGCRVVLTSAAVEVSQPELASYG